MTSGIKKVQREAVKFVPAKVNSRSGGGEAPEYGKRARLRDTVRFDDVSKRKWAILSVS